VRSVRKQKNIAFAAVGDGSSLESVQVVLTPQQAQGWVKSSIILPQLTCSSITTGCAVSIAGEWKKCPPGAKQSHELVAQNVTLVGEHDAEVSGATETAGFWSDIDVELPIAEEISQFGLFENNTTS
jgi:asparaginyl-tRNA synthetase